MGGKKGGQKMALVGELPNTPSTDSPAVKGGQKILAGKMTDTDGTDAPSVAQGSKSDGKARDVTTTSLDHLQSTESRKIMDIVDRLRRSGLSGVVQLPQIVVTGDQSSGKSSVLEAITEIPFPRKENLCTRFATEIILRRAATASISTKIIPDKTRPSVEKQRLEAFRSQIVDFSELPQLMEEATNAMGLGDHGSEPATARAFSRDVLSIDIAGPGRPHLTLVDLPGLIHTETKVQSKEDVALIRDLVDDYIKQQRTIIVAVVSAKNDYANQVILDKCREVDPKGHRTLGLVTKPDFLEPSSENEAIWMELVKNQDIFFELGWHMLKNRTDKEINTSFQQRNASEKLFFSTGSYRDLSSDMLGVKTLRTRLSALLYKHLKSELPALQKELDDKHHNVTRDLGLLGQKRSTSQEQRKFLTLVGKDFERVVDAAVQGHYDDPFFGSVEAARPVGHDSNMVRFRAVVQYLNLQFASTMRDSGQMQKTVEPNANAQIDLLARINELSLDDGYSKFLNIPEYVKREDAVEKVKNILIRSRGRELPGMPNPDLISELFWGQSANWSMIAEYHIDRVAAMCQMFVRKAVQYTVASDVSDRLSVRIDRALEQRLQKAKSELKVIVRDTKRHPITYDPRYIESVQQRRNAAYSDMLHEMASKWRQEAEDRNADVNPHDLADRISKSKEGDIEKVSAEEALDASQAYYEDEVKYFIAVVTKQVIERYLLTDLAAETMSPMVIVDMSDEEVGYVAAEPEETTRKRDFLETRKATLEKGQETFRSALGMFAR